MLEALREMVDFYHDEEKAKSKLGCTLSSLASFCLHNSTDAKFYPFTESDKSSL